MDEPEKITTFEDLTNLFSRDEVLHQVDHGDKSVLIPTEQGTLDSVLLMRWQESDGVLQFIQQIQVEFSPDRLPVLAEAVTRLNHALAIPGFDINYERLILAYRLYLPIEPRGYVTTAEIQAMFRLTVSTAANLRPVVAAVIDGRVAAVDVVTEGGKQYPAAD